MAKQIDAKMVIIEKVIGIGKDCKIWKMIWKYFQGTVC